MQSRLTSSPQSTPRVLLAPFIARWSASSANDLADLRAPDAVHEFPLLTPGQPRRYGHEEIRTGFASASLTGCWRVEGVPQADRDTEPFESGHRAGANPRSRSRGSPWHHSCLGEGRREVRGPGGARFSSLAGVSPAGAQTIAYRRNQEYPGQSVREN
jgi:hypothetical protein